MVRPPWVTSGSRQASQGVLIDLAVFHDEDQVFARIFQQLDVGNLAAQARLALAAHPDITVIFAPYDEFARGVKMAVDDAKLSSQIKIYSADISTPDIVAMREPGSSWAATAATNPAVVGRVSVRALAMLLAGEDPGRNIIVPPTLITQAQPRDADIKDMESLGTSCLNSTAPMSRCRHGCRCRMISDSRGQPEGDGPSFPFETARGHIEVGTHRPRRASQRQVDG